MEVAAAAAAAEDAEVAASTGGSTEARTAEADGTGTTKEEATAGAVEAVATITKGLAAAEGGAAPARAAARRTGPAAAARGRRGRVRGEALGLAASTPPSGGQRRRLRLRLGRLRLRPWSRKRRVRRDPLVSASPDLLAPTIQLLHCSAFGVRDIFKVPFRAAMIISGLSKKKKNSSMVDRVVGAVWFGADQRCLAQADIPGVGLGCLVWSQGRFGADQHCLAKA